MAIVFKIVGQTIMEPEDSKEKEAKVLAATICMLQVCFKSCTAVWGNDDPKIFRNCMEICGGNYKDLTGETLACFQGLEMKRKKELEEQMKAFKEKFNAGFSKGE